LNEDPPSAFDWDPPFAFDWVPGPWYSLPQHQRAWRWVRYQIPHKVSAFIHWMKLTAIWFTYWRWLERRDPDTTFCNRIVGDADALCPTCAWELTVAQDAPQLERYWEMVPSGTGGTSRR
jgi:hypothetical protein